MGLGQSQRTGAVWTPVITPAMVLAVDELVRPGDLEAGDVIALPEEAGRFLVSAVRLGQGGFILVVAPANDSQPGAERHVTLTTAVRVRRLGRVRVIRPDGPARHLARRQGADRA